MLQSFTIKKKSNSNINISNISNVPFDVMCFLLGRTMMMTLYQMKQQLIGVFKKIANKIGANVMALCEGTVVNDKIKK